MHRVFKILLGLVLVIGLVLLVLSTGRQPEPFPESSESAARLLPGPHSVQQYDEEFIDESRSTDANDDFPGEPVRRMVGTVWHPADNSQGPYPLIVYSHGFSSMREGGEYLGKQLASLGYVVVAVDYPLTNFYAPGRPSVKDVVNQPGDVSFLIDTLIAQSTQPGHTLEGLVDPERIGVTGISLGGMTTTLVTFHPTMGDPRIKAALSIAGPTAQFTEGFFSGRRVPFLMLAADIDALVPWRSNALPVLELIPGSQLVTVRRGSHTGFAGPSAPLRWLSNPDSIGCYTVLHNIENDMEEPWYDLLGTPEQGINYTAEYELCQMDPLPPAMNPLRQQMITSVVVSSFFQSQFARSVEERAAASQFLSETLAAELEEVEYASSDG
ncbi:MAG: hypothetical protein O7F73_09595 [Gammaproteobacteria bacterium]|nr:hypothetical protein [Gammaproteobacteria bacterium]